MDIEAGFEPPRGVDMYDEGLAERIREPHAHPFDITGRPLRGFLYVEPEGFDSDEDLRRWIGRGLAFAGLLPDK